MDRGQRRKFIQAASNDLAAFLQGLSLIPLRPGALAALTVGDFNPRLKTMKIGRDKYGQDRKITPPEESAAILSQAAKNKLSAAPLFSRSNGSPWNKDAWKWPIKSAAAAADLPAETTAYTIRHSVITDLVNGGRNLLTVAQLAGTSVAMIEKHTVI